MKIMGKTTSKKPYVGAISSDAFYVGESKTYGLEKVDLIVAYALENGIDLVTASREFGMTDEKIDLLKLVYARELYKDGLIKQGNVYLNSVEESPKKTELVNEVLSEVRRRRQFYQHRPVEKPEVKVLVRPGKRHRIEK